MGVDMRTCPDAYASQGWPATWERLCLNGEDW